MMVVAQEDMRKKMTAPAATLKYLQYKERFVRVQMLTGLLEKSFSSIHGIYYKGHLRGRSISE
jgi:hypothetical protein